MNFKDVKPEKIYDVDQVALLCKTEKLPFLHQIITSESKLYTGLLFDAFGCLTDEQLLKITEPLRILLFH